MNDNKSDYKANIESILLGYYIKYTRLEQLTAETLAKSPYVDSNDIDIYVDLYDMFHKLYSVDIYATKTFTIVSSVINLAAHLRSFYWSRYHVNSKIYLVYGDCSTMNHKQFYMKFGETDIDKTRNYEKISSIVNSQLDMIGILCRYIYGVYLVRKTTDFCMFTYDNIIKSPQGVPSLIITKSKYAYQIPAMCENAMLYRPKKINGEDISFAITHENVIYKYCNKINNEKAIQQLGSINPRLLSLLMVLSGLPSKKLLTLMNTTTSIGRLYKAISEGRIINDYNSDIDYVYNQLELFNKIDPTSFKYRFNATDLIYQYNIYKNQPESLDTRWCVDLYDPDTVKDINNKYFIDNPLDLNSL